jgi:hypothetical protein
MQLNREPIWAAFFALLFPALTQGSGGPFISVSRRARNYTQVTPVEQPALYLIERRETASAKNRGLPTIWHLHGEIYIYARNELNQVAAGSGGGQVLNPLIDAVEGAINPGTVPGMIQTLGGLVSRAFIDGDVQVDEGNLDNQAVAIIPIHIIGPV